MIWIQVFNFFVSLITILSCHGCPQASWQPIRLLWQDVCRVQEGIFSQWWVLTRKEGTYKIFFQERVGSASTNSTAWLANDLTRWRSQWLTTMEPAMWLCMTSSRLYQIKFINICNFENLIVKRAEKDCILISTQVGAGDDFVLTVTGFNATLSTLGDSMALHNGKKFSTK